MLTIRELPRCYKLPGPFDTIRGTIKFLFPVS